MTMFGSQWLANAGGAGYEIDQSIRFDKTASSHLSNTYASAGNRKTWTFSTWFKRGKIDGTRQSLFAATGTAYLQVGPDAASREMITILNEGSGTDLNWYTTQVFRDASAWYHLVWQFDSTQATADDRTKLYINGSQVTDFTKAATPAQNFEGAINNAVEHKIGELHIANYYFDGYQAEINFIDGTALDPTSFGEYNDDGVWIPKAYDGSYGTNGFYLTGEDSTFLGQDVRTSGDQVNSFQSSQYTGATSDYTFSDGQVEADTSNRAIRTVDTFTGDFEFTWRYVNMANFIFGLYEIDEDATFSSTSSAGNMQNMTDSWYVQTSSVAANRDIKYGGTTVVDSTTIANGDVWKMTRESGTIKVYRNGSLVHTFTQTSTNEVRLVISQGDSAADANQVAWVDNSTLGNNFFSSGLATTDQMLDTPTDNFCTWNPLRKGPAHTLSDGNLLITSTIADATFGTFMVDSGKWYWEITALSAEIIVGIGDTLSPPTAAFDTAAAINTRGYNGYNGQKTNNGSGSAYGATYTTNDVIGIALNMDDGEITFYKNDVSQGVAFTGLTGFWGPGASVGNTRSCRANFGQTAFTYTPPTGFNALSTANLATPSIKDGTKNFDVSLWTGNDTDGRAITGYNFQPDWVWIKSRSSAYSHSLTDAVRGAGKYVQSNTSDPEVNGPGAFGSTLAFTSDGFTLDNGTSDNLYVNAGGVTYVGWAWKANGAGSSNGDGDITSTVSANTTAGFSVVTYSGNGSDNQEIGHGLGLAPKMIISKRRNASGNWTTYHDAVGINKVFYLNSTAAPVSNTEQYRAVPTSSVYTVGVGGDINNASGTYVAYCFAEIPGYSSFGSYTGNGSTDGPFVYTGFTPRYVLFKRTNAAESWPILDTARGSSFGADAGTGGDNPTAANDLNAVLVASTNAAEEDNPAGSRRASFNSNGFKVRTTNTAMNGSGSTYIYMAFAEHPFGGDGAAPATAR